MSIPKNAKRVFKGDIFDVYQWRQKMFDGSFHIFEAVKRQDTVIILASVGNKMIVLRQKQPNTGWFYCTPSGSMDKKGELPKTAALRELLEETGMKPEKFFLYRKHEKRGKLVSTIYTYVARNCKKVAEQKLDNGEKIVVNLFSFDQYLKLSDNPHGHLEETLGDMLRARADRKFYRQYKKVVFG